jgi:hypothetical protein
MIQQRSATSLEASHASRHYDASILLRPLVPACYFFRVLHRINSENAF